MFITNYLKDNSCKSIFFFVLLMKFILMVLFTSDYQRVLFMPFVDHFVTYFDNPWQFYYKIQQDKFPYPPLMLYILSAAYLPYKLIFGSDINIVVQNLFFKMPVLISDLAITFVLLRILPAKTKGVLFFYFLSPAIIYAAYIHSQLDIISIAFLMLSLYFLAANKLLRCAILFGCAISIKFSIVVTLPLIIIYVSKNHRFKDTAILALMPAVVYLFFSFPYLFTEGYYYMVIKNPKQMSLFDLYLRNGDLKIYLPIFAILVLYGRFWGYSKINSDLLYTFSGIIFTLTILLVYPTVSWIVWVIPFLSIFFIENISRHAKVLYLYLSFNTTYLIYVLFFHKGDYNDLVFLNKILNLKIHIDKLKDISYTAFEAILVALIYYLYKFGIESNEIYKKDLNLVIGIGGDSAAGKTTLLEDLKHLLCEQLLQVEGDADHKWTRDNINWQYFTHLNPKANYLHRQVQNIIDLKNNKPVYRCEYDHMTGTFTETQLIRPQKYIVLSGLHTFYLPIARKIIDLKIYLDTDEKLRQHWKILRDTQHRSYSCETILEQIEKRTQDSVRYIHPQKGYADITISYFTEEDFLVGTHSGNLSLMLKVTLTSNVHIENLIRELEIENINLLWDYSDDLNTQYVILKDEPSGQLIKKIAFTYIPNLKEIIPVNATWLNGYRGFVQLIILFLLSVKKREISTEEF
ncbi:MAG: hypothetical protein H7844_10275 [Nitrospirae bacterium YQR-1]